MCDVCIYNLFYIVFLFLICHHTSHFLMQIEDNKSYLILSYLILSYFPSMSVVTYMSASSVAIIGVWTLTIWSWKQPKTSLLVPIPKCHSLSLISNPFCLSLTPKFPYRTRAPEYFLSNLPAHSLFIRPLLCCLPSSKIKWQKTILFHSSGRLCYCWEAVSGQPA